MTKQPRKARGDARMEALMKLYDRLSKEGRSFDCQVIASAVRSWQATLQISRSNAKDATAYRALKAKVDGAPRES